VEEEEDDDDDDDEVKNLGADRRIILKIDVKDEMYE